MNAHHMGGLLALPLFLTLFGCPPGETDTNPDSDTSETGDTSIPDTTGTLQVNSTFDGNPVNCFFNLDEVKYGTTNSPVSGIPVGSYTLALGDLVDGNWIHELGPDDIVTSPTEPVTVVEGDNEPVDKPFNQFAEGEWTCQIDGRVDQIYTAVVIYRNGEDLTLPFVGDVKVAGKQLGFDDGTITKTGEFTSRIEASVDSTGGMAGTYSAECWKGNENDRP